MVYKGQGFQDREKQAKEEVAIPDILLEEPEIWGKTQEEELNLRVSQETLEFCT